MGCTSSTPIERQRDQACKLHEKQLHNQKDSNLNSNGSPTTKQSPATPVQRDMSNKSSSIGSIDKSFPATTLLKKSSLSEKRVFEAAAKNSDFSSNQLDDKDASAFNKVESFSAKNILKNNIGKISSSLESTKSEEKKPNNFNDNQSFSQGPDSPEELVIDYNQSDVKDVDSNKLLEKEESGVKTIAETEMQQKCDTDKTNENLSQSPEDIHKNSLTRGNLQTVSATKSDAVSCDLNKVKDAEAKNVSTTEVTEHSNTEPTEISTTEAIDMSTTEAVSVTTTEGNDLSKNEVNDVSTIETKEGLSTDENKEYLDINHQLSGPETDEDDSFLTYIEQNEVPEDLLPCTYDVFEIEPVEKMINNISKHLLKLDFSKHQVEERSFEIPPDAPQKLLGDGAVYTGDLVNNKPEGIGRTCYESGNFHIGEYKDGKPNGYGIYESMRFVYKGLFVDGKAHGFAVYTFDDGTKNGKKHGVGILRAPNGEMYEGSFRKGKIEGVGKYTWQDGRVYIGTWKDNIQHGYAEFRWKNKQKYIGFYAHGKMGGYGVLELPNGCKYDGMWLKGLQHGRGKYWGSNRWYREVEFDNGKFVQWTSEPISNSP